MRWLNMPRPWLLLISLSLNLFLAGIIGAAIAMGPHGFRGDGHILPSRHLLRVLGEEARPAVEQAMARHKYALKQAGRAHRTSSDAFRTALIAEPFDRQALSDIMAARRETRAELRMHMDTVFVEIAQDIGLDARKQLAERRRKRGARKAGWRSERSGHDHPGHERPGR